MSLYIEQTANELSRDAVGLWQIVPDGRQGFGLAGEASTDYVRRCVAELLARGAVPVIGGGETDYLWLEQPRYGSDPETITETVVREWLANGAKDEDAGGLWFALPQPKDPHYVRRATR